jgi:gluconolactonase
MPSTNTILAVGAVVGCALAQKLPATAQVVDQKIFNVLNFVPPPVEANDSTVCICCIWGYTTQKLIRLQLFVWPGVTADSLLAKPFHIYDEEFYDVIGSNPSLTQIASSDTDPIFHEAVTW